MSPIFDVTLNLGKLTLTCSIFGGLLHPTLRSSCKKREEKRALIEKRCTYSEECFIMLLQMNCFMFKFPLKMQDNHQN